LTDPEINIRLNICTNMSTTPENMVKIGLVDFEIPLLPAIVKKEEKEEERKNRKESNSSIT